MTNLGVDIFKYCGSIITELSLLVQMLIIVIQLLSLSFFVALDWESTDDKLAFHINALDCCMYAACMHKTEKTKGISLS